MFPFLLLMLEGATLDGESPTPLRAVAGSCRYFLLSEQSLTDQSEFSRQQWEQGLMSSSTDYHDAVASLATGLLVSE